MYYSENQNVQFSMLRVYNTETQHAGIMLFNFFFLNGIKNYLFCQP